MTDEINPKRIAQLLTQGTRQMDAVTLSALNNARQKALQRQSVRAPIFTLATGRFANLLLPFSNHHWLSVGLITVMLVIGISYLQHAQEQQNNELDVAILTDDLPIEVFVD